MLDGSGRTSRDSDEPSSLSARFRCTVEFVVVVESIPSYVRRI